MNKRIYILLPVHNRREITRRFIECLKAQTYQDYHLVLIDDGSSDGTAEMVSEYIESLTIIKGKGDWWWAGALQQGYRWLKSNGISKSDVVLIINDDTEFDSTFFHCALHLLMSADDTLLLAQCYSKQTGKILDTGVHIDWSQLAFHQASVAEEINCLSTRGLFLTADSFYTIGGFYPRILPHYASDYEFTIRAHNKGFTLSSDPQLRLWVDEDTTGYHNLDTVSFRFAIKNILSRKAIINPVVWTIFIAISCPWRWKVINWIRVWGYASKVLMRRYREDKIIIKSIID